MKPRCRPMEPRDFGRVESVHWRSIEEVARYAERQGLASLLAFDGPRCVGQLYLKAYEPGFACAGGWRGERPWADFVLAEPLDLPGRFLTLGCYHVGRRSDGTPDPTLRGHGIGRALLDAAVERLRSDASLDGLVAWALVAGSKPLLAWAGQLPHTAYRRAGFREIARIRDSRLERELADVDTSAAEEDPCLLRVMRLDRADVFS